MHTKGKLEVNTKSKAIQSLESGGNIALVCITYKSEEVEVQEEGESWLDMRHRTKPKRMEADEEKQANAERIVKTWNCHDKIVEALSDILDAWGGSEKISEGKKAVILEQAINALKNAQ